MNPRTPLPWILAGLLVLTGCGSAKPTPTVSACATLDQPPIVLADPVCAGPDRRLYHAPASDVGADDVPVPGEPLDGDFWDWTDQLDLDEREKYKTKSSKATPTPTSKASLSKVATKPAAPTRASKPSSKATR